MHNSAILFLINDDARLISATYDGGQDPTLFKTMDQDIKRDDLVVVQSGTRHMVTTAKVIDIDLEPDFDSSTEIKWVIQRVNVEAFAPLLLQEAEAVAMVQSAERQRKKDELRATMFNNDNGKIQTLALAKSEQDDSAVTE